MMKINKAIFIFFLIFMASQHVYGAAFKYTSYDRRDPFVPLVGVPQEGTTAGVLGILTIDDVELGGIAVDPDGKRSVIINNEIMREGDGIGHLSVESIGTNVVKVKINGESHELKLYE
ncbi:MAG: hypothetical protein ABID83_03320 [Candidatus Omnitrophota bacterium]